MLSVVTLLAGLLLGFIGTWFVLRSQLAAATERGRSGAEVEIATTKERLRLLEDENRQIDVTLTKTKEELDATRQALALARNETAQLTERASRLSSLEAELEKSRKTSERQTQPFSNLQRAKRKKFSSWKRPPSA